MAHFARQAADDLAAQGIDAEVIDVRSLSPIDYNTIGESVGKLGESWSWKRVRKPAA